MKTILILFTMMISLSAIANEVIILRGQRLVLFSAKTSKQIELILADAHLTKVEKVIKIQSTMKAENKYCAVAGKNYANVNRTPKDVEKKCSELIISKYFAEDLVESSFEPNEMKDLRIPLSQYFTILLMF